VQRAVAASFGSVLRASRQAAGISQEELASRAGLHRTYVSLMERGHRAPSIEVVRQLATALGTTMAELIADTERALAEGTTEDRG
jgi:transcriptional regulator with XRE-family HTH domain